MTCCGKNHGKISVSRRSRKVSRRLDDPARVAPVTHELNRILDPDNDHIRLDPLAAAAKVLGLDLRIELVG